MRDVHDEERELFMNEVKERIKEIKASFKDVNCSSHPWPAVARGAQLHGAGIIYGVRVNVKIPILKVLRTV